MGLFDRAKKAMRSAGHDGRDPVVLSRGLKGTAEVVSAKDLGQDWYELVLRVSLPNREPYEHTTKQRIAAAGAVVGVSVNPNDLHEVYIGDPPTVATPMSPTIEEVWATGVPGRARLRETFEMNYVAVNGDPVVGMECEVTAEGRPPYKWRHGMRWPPDRLGRLEPGTEFEVRVLADKPDRIAFDWAAS